MQKIDLLLQKMDERTRDCFPGLIADKPIFSDRALFLLLTQFKDDLPPLNGRFHKNFRQTDVTAFGKVDAAIWCLLQASTLFWVLFDEVEGDIETHG